MTSNSGAWAVRRHLRSRDVPLAMPGVAFYYRADRGVVVDGSNVSQWLDQSGQGNHLSQATAARQPAFTASNARFNGYPSIDFAKAQTEYLFGADLPICSAMSGADKPLTVFAVVRRSTKISADEYVFTLGNSGQATQSYLSGGYRYQSSNSQRVNSDVRDDAGTTATNSTGLNEATDLGPQVLCWSFSGTAASIYVVGNSQNPRYDVLSNTNGTGSDYSAQGAEVQDSSL